MEIDHVFMLTDSGGARDVEALRAAGLAETGRRRHPGQGTENVCFLFDNLFLELLWVHDAAEARSAAIARTQLYERSLWRSNGANPFGISWRDGADGRALAAPAWDYRPPYLPDGHSIPIALDSDDPCQPLMFRSPGVLPPAAWPAERRGTLQHSAGLGRIVSLRLDLPRKVPPSPALRKLAAHTLLAVGEADGFALTVEAERRDGTRPFVLRLPFVDPHR